MGVGWGGGGGGGWEVLFCYDKVCWRPLLQGPQLERKQTCRNAAAAVSQQQ